MIPGTKKSVASLLDITRLKQAEEKVRLQQEQLFHAARMASLGTMAAGVAHDINNPNTFIMGSVPMLENFFKLFGDNLDLHYKEKGDLNWGGLKYPELVETMPILLSGVRKGAARIKQIVKDLKEFGRQDTPDLNESFDINAAKIGRASCRERV